MKGSDTARESMEKERDTSSDTLIQQLDLPEDYSHRYQRHHSLRKLCLIHFGVFVAYMLTGILIMEWIRMSSQNQCQADKLIPSPANDAVEYHRITWQNALHGNSPYTGEPSPEVDQAWRNLVQYMNIRVSKEDLHRLNQSSVPLQDEAGGYLVSLDVYHELHCVNMIRKHLRPDYYPNSTPMVKQLEHLDHCIDMLRLLVMCKGDTSLMTYSWIEGYRKPWPNFRQDHVCRNFDMIDEWSREHHIPVQNLQGPILIHPELGISWPIGSI